MLRGFGRVLSGSTRQDARGETGRQMDTPMTAFPAAARLAALRAAFSALGLDGVVVPRTDAWRSEVSAPREDCLAYLTGFTGSAGLALVLADRALLFVDGRYGLQARRQVDGDLYAFRHLHAEPVEDVLRQDGPALRIGVDPMRVSSAEFDRLAEAVDVRGGALFALETDLFDGLWPDRPPAPTGPVRPMPVERAGRSAPDKRREAAEALRMAGADTLIETSPENIAWLLNVRGADVPMNPVVQSFLILRDDGTATWFVDPRKLPNGLAGLDADGVRVARPEELPARLAGGDAGRRAILDPAVAPAAVAHAASAGGSRLMARSSPLTLAKARKTPAERAGYRRCHVEDGAALTDFLAIVAATAAARAATADPMTELEAETLLEACRATRPGYLEPSFRSISASGPNAALCHYAATPHTNAPLGPGAPYLIDSGGQYVDGTTDVTRTLFLAPAHPDIRRAYTAVLKGFLGLSMARFPVGTFGHQLDALARMPLWAIGLDYDHGTGHGVGHNLLIHEFPHRFGKAANPFPLEPGMIMTIEPGFYRPEAWGLRIENQVEVVEDGPGFCRFEPLTLAPIDVGAVDVDALTPAEIDHLDRYHARVRAVLAPLVRPLTRVFLDHATRPLEV